MESYGFVLSPSAQYAFSVQDVYPDILSFAAAIPDHLKAIFLIPVKMEPITASLSPALIRKVAQMDGSTPEGDLFSYQTFLYNDLEPTVPSSDPGSIFDVDGADSMTHHQEYNFDQNIQVPTDTSYMSDVDITPYQSYPYRTEEKPVRKSSIDEKVLIYRLAVLPERLRNKTPSNIKDNASKCTVSLVTYVDTTRTFIFNVDSGNGAKTVKAAMSDIDHVALSCTCPFWRYNGPEYNARHNNYLLGNPSGTAAPPNQKDPERKYWLCKHAYAVVIRLQDFVKEIEAENWDVVDDDELLEIVGDQHDRMAEEVEIPLDQIEAPEDEEWQEEVESQEPDDSEYQQVSQQQLIEQEPEQIGQQQIIESRPIKTPPPLPKK
jgi:SWIM zinc finger